MIAVKIVYISSKGCAWDDRTIRALVTELTSRRSFVVSHGSMCYAPEDRVNPAIVESLKAHKDGDLTHNRNLMNVVELYSSKSNIDYDNFLVEFERKFPPISYRHVTHNCADAVNFALDYFFTTTPAACAYTLLRFACGWTCCCTCGCCYCLPAPPRIATPFDVWNRARLLAYSYGAMPETALGAPLQAGFADPAGYQQLVGALTSD